MTWISRGLIALTAALHIFIAWFEIFAWTTVGPDVFSTFDSDLFPQTIDLAANQGIYNAFLAVGLLWSLAIRDVEWRFRVAVCFLSFVAIAGITATVTIGISSGIPQLLTATLALAASAIDRSKAASSSTVITDSNDITA